MARQRAREALDSIRKGIDPVEDRKAAKAALVAAHKRGMTFREAAKRYLALDPMIAVCPTWAGGLSHGILRRGLRQAGWRRASRMEERPRADTIFVGLDVHKATISVAIAEGERGGEVRHWGTITNRADHVCRLAEKLGSGGRQLHFCYEAGPCGYGLYRQLTISGTIARLSRPRSYR